MRLRTISICLCILLLSCAVLAQSNITGTISGIITDPSGAVVPGATVTVTNADQGRVVRTVKTDASGAYSAPLLPVGRYTITVDASGFKKMETTGININVNDKLTQSFQLQVGASEQTVNVEAAQVEVNLVNSTGSELITGTQVRELTLNNRNYVQLLTLSPGVSSTTAESYYVGVTNPVTGGVNTIGFSVNGTRNSSNNWTIDGADNVDRGSNITLLSTPSVDSIAEFKLVRSNYDAEYGRAASGQVQVVTRSGTSQFHGSAYEFWRNENLNADNYMVKRTRFTSAQCAPFRAAGNALDCDTRVPQRYHNFGYNLGGPVPLGGLRKNTFFFFNEEWRRSITYSSQVSTMPTADELQGNFSVPVCIAFSATGSCTATGTKITTITPTAAAYIKDVYSGTALSTNPLTHSVTNFFRNVINHRQEAVKLDHNFGRLSAYGRYTHEANPSEQPLGLFGPNCLMPNACSNHVEAPGWTFAGHFTFTKSATTLIDGGYNFSYGAILADVTGTLDSDKSPNVKPTLPYANTQHVIPALSFTNSMSGIAIEPRYRDYNRNHQIYANLTKVVGRHTWKFGGTYYHYQKTENAAGNNHGTFNFNGVNVAGGPNPNCNSSSQTNGISNSVYCTEQGWANFLLGRVNTFTQASIDITPDIQDNQFEFFAQDEWRIKSNLTISYGLRYSLFRQPTDANGLLTTFDPKYYDPAKAFQINPTTGDRVPGTGDPLNGIIPTASALKKCPTLGNATSVPCWGSGVKAPYGNKVGNEDMKDFAPRVGVAWDPFGSGKTSLRSGFGYFYDTSLFGIIEQNIFSNPPFSNSIVISNTNFENPGSVLPSVSAAPVVGQARAGAPWKTPRTYHYNLDLQQQFVHGILFTAGYFGNVGRNLIGIFDLNQPQVGAYVGTAADASVGATTNPCGTGHCVTSGTTPRLNALRPYKGYFGISTIRPIFNSNYNSLQSTMTKRFRGNSSVGIAYTWSHALTDNQSDRSNAPQNTYNIHGDYGPTLQDRRHIFTANWVYELPWLKDQKGFLGHVAGGWELTGILTAQTGLPNTVTGETLDRAGQGCLSGSTVCGLRPDQIGDPNIGAPHQWNGPGLGSTGGPQWITGAAFIQTPGDQIRPGTERRGPVYGPGFWRTDLSAVKNFKVTERVAMQFRADAFNVLNHTNPNGFASLAITSAIFGQISTATSGVRDPRQIALGLKVNF